MVHTGSLVFPWKRKLIGLLELQNLSDLQSFTTNPLHSKSSLTLFYVSPIENLKVPFQTVMLICRSSTMLWICCFLKVSEHLKIDLYIGWISTSFYYLHYFIFHCDYPNTGGITKKARWSPQQGGKKVKNRAMLEQPTYSVLVFLHITIWFSSHKQFSFWCIIFEDLCWWFRR